MKVSKGDELYYRGRRVSEPTLCKVIAITTDEAKQIGLEFKTDVGGHSCDGRGKQGFCLWARSWDLMTKAEYKAMQEAQEAAIANAPKELDSIEL
jgi:hypothetical protein